MQLVAPPAGFERTLGVMPEGVRPLSKGTLDFALLFARTQRDLRKEFPRLKDR